MNEDDNGKLRLERVNVSLENIAAAHFTTADLLFWLIGHRIQLHTYPKNFTISTQMLLVLKRLSSSNYDNTNGTYVKLWILRPHWMIHVGAYHGCSDILYDIDRHMIMIIVVFTVSSGSITPRGCGFVIGYTSSNSDKEFFTGEICNVSCLKDRWQNTMPKA